MPPPHGARPLWMKNLLEANFYGDNDTCDIEGHRWKTVFCKSCMDGPICGKCCRDLHENHDVLQVYKASKQVAVPKDDIMEDMDTDGIQPFIVNSRPIFFLHAKANKSVQNGQKCEICEGHIMDPEYKFCSIACKVESVGGTSLNGEVDQPPPNNGLEVKDNTQEVRKVQLPIRTHSRKTTPSRSPLN
ncbi:uncharacterized protein LOC113752285 [Coffea eugenioides]|uniref:uncharacterized protein LOC113752285 n=1 Tax=Coffea eugenioides TaxID=49369 RepID=UPI000F6103E2|nr:uncharacterized protein LOC113752285 [Coffea eugenioides]